MSHKNLSDRTLLCQIYVLAPIDTLFHLFLFILFNSDSPFSYRSPRRPTSTLWAATMTRLCRANATRRPSRSSTRSSRDSRWSRMCEAEAEESPIDEEKAKIFFKQDLPHNSSWRVSSGFSLSISFFWYEIVIFKFFKRLSPPTRQWKLWTYSTRAENVFSPF